MGLILLAELCGLGLGPHPGLPLARQCRLGLVGSPSLGIQLLAQGGNRRLQRPDCAADIAVAVTGLVTLTLRLLGRDGHPDSAVIAGLTSPLPSNDKPGGRGGADPANFPDFSVG